MKQKQIILTTIIAGLIVFILFIAFFIYVAGGRPTFTDTSITQRIENSIATADGKTVSDILHMRGVTNTDWSISHGDWIGFEGTAIASCLISNGTTEVFVWQWDAAWPHALALTPNTVTIFPLMDPGVKLTSDGRTALWSGRGAIEEYFEKE